MPKNMSGDIPNKYIKIYIPENIPNKIPKDIPNKMPKNMSKYMPENIPYKIQKIC